MKIPNNNVLDQFRERLACELCGVAVGRAEVHHWHARGIGGGHQIDVAINIVACCRSCHQRAEDGNIPKRLVLLHLANRHETTPDAIQQAIWYLDRLPKGTSKEGILAGSVVLGGEIERMVRVALNGG